MSPRNGEYCNDHDVLVVEDDSEINQLIGAYVELAGFHYVGAIDGSEAFARISDHLPCAVILDLMLPDVNGWEICRRLKSERETFDIPIIILSALDSDEARREGERCGVAQYLTKPFNPDEFLEVLSRHAGDRKTVNSAE